MVDNRTTIRRSSDSVLQDQINRQVESHERLQQQIMQQAESINEIKRILASLEERHEDRDSQVITKAVYQAQKAFFGNIGVDIDSTVSIDQYRRNLQFGLAMRGSMFKVAGAIIFGFCGVMGAAAWNIITGAITRG
jgi:hypothetical protein